MNNQKIIDAVLTILNEALEADRKAITFLMNSRVSVNDKIAQHPTIQVQARPNGVMNNLLGPIGLINGFVELLTQERIAFVSDDSTGMIQKFIVYKENEQ